MDDIDVPHFFICPISLDIMKDPVTLSTGITYDRKSIEEWIFSGNKAICPLTKQAISSDSDLTPNHTLRRLIQSWCVLNAAYGVTRIPTPRLPISKAQISKLLKQSKLPQSQMKCLQRLKSMVCESETNRRCMEAAGVAEVLASIINSNNSILTEGISKQDAYELTRASDEALSILYHLQLSETSLKTLIGENGDFFESLTRVMNGDNYDSRTYAVVLLTSVLEVTEPLEVASLGRELFTQIVEILRHGICEKASKAALKVLISTCSLGRNKIKAIEAGAVPVLIDILLDCFERRVCEMVLMALDLLCQCAEGRAEFLQHKAGLAVVSKKILRISQVASERAVRVLFSISKFSSTPIVLQEMLQVGVVAKLCLSLQVNWRSNCKEKAREILKLHAGAWKNSACLPMNFISSYPSEK